MTIGRAASLALLTLALAGCQDQARDLVALKIELNALKHEMEYLRLQTEELDPRVRSAEQMALHAFDEREAPFRLDCTEHRLGIVATRLAPITVECESVARTDTGYRIALRLGNPTSGRLDGVQLTMYAGAGAWYGRSEARLHVPANVSLPPGAWRTVDVELPGLAEGTVSDLALRAQIERIALAER